MQMGATDKGRWAYACSKAIDEFLAMAYWRERALPTIVVRLFNTVGPRQTGRYGMVVPRLVGQALAGEPLTVYGDGRQTRCFCHVADVVQALFGLMTEESAYGNVFNVGATTEISVLDLAQRIIEVTGSCVGYLPDPLRRGLRRGLRGHVPPRARHREGAGAHRLAPEPLAGEHRPGRGGVSASPGEG